MRCLVQRVSEAEVAVGGSVAGKINAGLVVLVCAMKGDQVQAVRRMAQKISRLRIFADEAGRMNRSVIDMQGAVLAVSQFTLAADTSRGNRPGFSDAAHAADAERLFEEFVAALRNTGIPVETGLFGEHMMLSLTNDGPATIWLELP
ncbi:MAG: D-aminoacyl-tRNA deacylase [Rhodobacteraceae bacterium]|nr:D-aminoacyl-tRNA deacylase [Paracoccaceae bacterium]